MRQKPVFWIGLLAVGFVGLTLLRFKPWKAEARSAARSTLLVGFLPVT